MRCCVGHLFRVVCAFEPFRVMSKGTMICHMVYRYRNHNYDFIHKRTSLELGRTS
jgi:hypothetical protein